MTNPKAKFEIVGDDKSVAAYKSAINNGKKFNAELNSLFKGAAQFAGVSIGINQIGDALYKAVQRGDSLDRLSKRMGTTVEFLSAMEYGAKQADVEFESLTAGFDTMSKNVSMAAQGTGRARQALKDLNLDAKELNKLPLDERLTKISAAMAGVQKDSDRTRISMQLFGDANFLSIFGEGADAIKEFTDNAKEAGGVMSTLTAQQLADADTAIKQLDTSWKNLTATAAHFWVLIGKDAGVIPLTGLEQSQKAIDELQVKRKGLLDSQKMFSTGVFSWFGDESTAKVDQYTASIAKLDAQLESMKIDQFNKFFAPKQKQETQRSIDPDTRAELDEGYKTIEALAKKRAEYHAKIEDATNDLAEDFRKHYEEQRKLGMSATDKEAEELTKRLEANQLMLDMKKKDQAQFERDRIAIIEEAGLVEIDINEIKSRKIADSSIAAANELTEYQKNLARNTQDIIADTIINGFDDGIDGALRAFAAMILKMEAQALAASWTKSLFGNGAGSDSGVAGSFVNAGLNWLLGSGGGGSTSSVDFWDSLSARANGGPVSAGGGYMVGEDGPEFFSPGSSGFITPNHALGGSGVTYTQVNHIDARGATQDVIKMLPKMLKQTHDAAISTIKNMQRRGQL